MLSDTSGEFPIQCILDNGTPTSPVGEGVCDKVLRSYFKPERRWVSLSDLKSLKEACSRTYKQDYVEQRLGCPMLANRSCPKGERTRSRWISRNFGEKYLGVAFKKLAFSTDSEEEEFKQVLLGRFSRKNKNLIVYGPYGSQTTEALVVLAEEFWGRNYDMSYVKWKRLTETLLLARNLVVKKEEIAARERVRRYKRKFVLVIDGFTMNETDSETLVAAFEDILNRRLSRNLVTIISSNEVKAFKEGDVLERWSRALSPLVGNSTRVSIVAAG